MKNLPELEKETLKFWQKNKVFEKSLKQREKFPRFVFYEGPPYANAQPGIHHVLARSFKDVVARYKTMKGFLVERRAGWDTHGLPAELEVEKKLSISSKSEIEKIGVEKFIKLCKENIFAYKKQWEAMTERMGYWIDLKNAYITCTNDYIESVWWALKQIWDKGLIYRDYKVMPYCSRCGTSLSDHEVAQGYKDVQDPSIYVKFKIKNSEFKDTYFLVWTTTPWTLPGNVALAVAPDIEYLSVKNKDEEIILAKDCLKILDGKYEILKNLKGKDLIGLEYEPLYRVKDKTTEGKKIYQVVPASFVKTEEGTGIVHMAPAFGAEDLEVAKKENLPIILNVDEEGKFKQGIKQWAGMFVKKADSEIIFDLEKRELLYKKETVLHTYPFCWRCDTPLLYYAKDSWYIKTTAVKDKMLDNNGKINWIPAYIKNGRFGNWLKENIDWAISRERYWGTPFPIWECEKCEEKILIGSAREIKELGGKVPDDFHKPNIDKVILKCQKCQGLMKRVPEVIDVWFDSGSMPYAQWHYPFENAKKFKENFPADFIAEGIDQTRGWFYTLLAISTLLDLGPSYKNVISLGLVLDKKGQKMSKSKGNIIFPDVVMDKYGADTVRLYFYLAPMGETIRFSEKELDEVFKKFMVTIYNSYIFYKTYGPKNPKSRNLFRVPARKKVPERSEGFLLDKWIISKSNQTIKEMTQNLEKYEITKSARLLYNFILNDLSNWYIRRSRKREESNFYQTLYKVLLDVCKLSSPFVPFISEEIYQNLKQKKDPQSIHLCDWSKAGRVDQNLIDQMDFVRNVIEIGHAIRAQEKIRVRQPLSELKIENLKLRNKNPSLRSRTLLLRNKGLLDLISEELNVKKVTEAAKLTKLSKNWLTKEEGGIKIALNTAITLSLKKEGYAREIVRHIQELRKELEFQSTDLVSTFWETDNEKMLDVFNKFQDYIQKGTRSKLLQKGKQGKGKETVIEGNKIWIGVKSENTNH